MAQEALILAAPALMRCKPLIQRRCTRSQKVSTQVLERYRES